MNYKELFGIIAGIVSTIAYVPYIYSIIKEETKPSRSSWWIWSLIGFLILFSYHSVGAIFTIWVPVCFFVCPLIIGILSIKYGEGLKLNFFDKVCVLGAITGVVFWKILGSAEVALFINISIDLIGYLPTIKKTYITPQYENKLTWILFLVGSILNIIAMEKFSFKISIYPIYMFIMDIIILSLIFRKKTRLSNYSSIINL